MKKRNIVLIIILTAVLTLTLNVFLGGYIRAKISQIPQLARFDFFNSEAPIVITRREVVRADDGTDVIDAINSAKAKMAAVVAVSNGQTVRTGNAISITSDGSFVTTSTAFAAPQAATYAVILSDGRIAPVEERLVDPATDLVFFKANVDNVAVASFGSSKELNVGQRVVMIEQTLKDFTPIATPVFVSVAQHDTYEQEYEANKPSRTYGIENVTYAVSGAALVTLSGDIVGMSDAHRLIAGDIMKRSISLYLADELKRPDFGFAYDLISPVRGKLLGLPEGVRVLRVAGSSAADKAGLQGNDIITAIGEQKVVGDVSFEEILENYKIGETIPFTITRGQKTLILNLTPTELK
ncbi:MAG: serine protease [Candidatus Doudnabacteria bacterium]|nr:serine protease [Candidatus Doudnabacteria bacterium]